MSSPSPPLPDRRHVGPGSPGRSGSFAVSFAVHSGILLAASSLLAPGPRGSQAPPAGTRVLLAAPPTETDFESRAVEPLPPPLEPEAPDPEPRLEPPSELPPPEPTPEPEPAPEELRPLPPAESLWARLGSRPLRVAPPPTPSRTCEEWAPADAPEPADPTDLESAPEPLAGWCPAPPYPPRAERAGWQGLVVLRLRVDEGGRVVGATVETSSGHDVLDRAALEAVRTWRFRPGTRAGRPAVLEYVQRISFEL